MTAHKPSTPTVSPRDFMKVSASLGLEAGRWLVQEEHIRSADEADRTSSRRR